MWLFKKEKIPPITPPIKVGERFIYLGIEMLCTRHFDFPYEFQVVKAEYVNTMGEIKYAVFPPCDWEVLRLEQETSAKNNRHRQPASEL